MTRIKARESSSGNSSKKVGTAGRIRRRIRRRIGKIRIREKRNGERKRRARTERKGKKQVENIKKRDRNKVTCIHSNSSRDNTRSK